MESALDKPNCAGWWWCIPDPECGWFERYPSGVVVQIGDYGGYDPDGERFYVSLTGTHDVVGFTREFPFDLFGKWFGPITLPIAAKDQTLYRESLPTLPPR